MSDSPNTNTNNNSSNGNNSNGSNSPYFDRDRILQQSQELASKGQSFASFGLNRLNGSVQRLDLQQRLAETRKRVTAGVQELELQQKYADSKQRVSESVKQMDLNQKLAVSKEKIRGMHLEQRLDSAKRGLGGAASLLGTNLQKLNFGKLIDKMEQDQGVADGLERKNQDYVDEQRAREMMREAGEACTAAIDDHLQLFIVEHPTATYEEWIADLHPENLQEGRLLEGMGKELDHRFYVEESDHRIMWNRDLGGVRLEVLPRSRMWLQKQQEIVDLLGSNEETIAVSNENSPAATSTSTTNATDDFFDIPVSDESTAIPFPDPATSAATQTNDYTADLLDMMTMPTSVTPPSQKEAAHIATPPQETQTTDSNSTDATTDLLWFQRT